MITKVFYEDLNLFLFDKEEETIEWCVFHIEGMEDEDGEMCDTYDVYTFDYEDVLSLAENFDEETFLMDLMDCGSEYIFTPDDYEFSEYQEEFYHGELVSGSAADIMDYLLSKIKENTLEL